MRVPLLVAKAPATMNAANCHLIRSSPVEMLLTPPSDPFFAFSAWASYHIIEEMPRHGDRTSSAGMQVQNGGGDRQKETGQ
jgi:hypothetical protein